MSNLVTLDHMIPGRPTYSVWVHKPEHPFDVIDHFDAVPDEFGTLQRIDNGQSYVSRAGADCHDFCDLAEAHAEHLRLTYPEAHARFELERKQHAAHRVITAEIKLGDVDWISQQIVIDRDDRRDVPRYRIDAGWDDVAVLTHAQLAALLFAAQEIVRPVRPRPPAVRYLARRRS